MNRLLLVLFACLAFTPHVAVGESGLSLNDTVDDRAPLKVSADRMVSDQEKGVIEFTGSVDAVKGSLRVVADKILVFTDDTKNDFSHIKAIGSVLITKGTKRATGDQAEYFRERNTMILTGSPTLDDGKSVASGEKVIYNFLTEEMTLLGGAGVNGQPGRATVTLFADEKNNIVTGEDVPITTPAPTPSPIVRARYTVQVAAFRDKEAAQKYVRLLTAKGYPDTRLVTDESKGKPVHRVRTGLFATKDEALILSERLYSKDGIDGLTLFCENGCD